MPRKVSDQFKLNKSERRRVKSWLQEILDKEIKL